MSDIRKKNLTEMLHLTYKEMKRIQGLKCPADIKMVEEHTAKLEDLNSRTIRIEAYAVATVALITLFGIVIGVIQYSNYKLAKETAVKDKPLPAIVSKQDLNHGIY